MFETLLYLAALCFLGSFAYTLIAVLAGRVRPGRFNLLAILSGFVLLSAFLYFRGQAEGSCPLNSLFDVLVFQSWALVLIYLAVGSAYRISLLGAFTAPLALLLLLLALFLPISHAPVPRLAINPWIEFHAALSIIAYGAFGMACVAGAMYLIQEKQLKSHKASPLLYSLPPIHDLAAVTLRLIWLGFGLLTISFFSGLISQVSVNSLKFTASLVIWAAYGIILLVQRILLLSPRRVASCAIVVFALALLSLPVIQHLSKP